WDGGWGEAVRWPSDAASEAVWAERLRRLGAGIDGAGLASVVPDLTPVLAEAVRIAFGTEAVAISADLPLPFRMAYRTPHTLGADRLAAAVAAHALAGGRAVVALDAGSAITTEAVSVEPAYLGGAILPGPDLLRRALARDTRQLPEVAWTLPASVIGTLTTEAIQAGLVALVLDGVAGLLDRTMEAVGGEPLVVATGGWGPWLAERLPIIDRVEPHLVLEGIRLLTEAV
ncbi:MAG: type III pantothenate kinase, partial [Bacteroidota bacterium]